MWTTLDSKQSELLLTKNEIQPCVVWKEKALALSRANSSTAVLLLEITPEDEQEWGTENFKIIPVSQIKKVTVGFFKNAVKVNSELIKKENSRTHDQICLDMCFCTRCYVSVSSGTEICEDCKVSLTFSE